MPGGSFSAVAGGSASCSCRVWTAVEILRFRCQRVHYSFSYDLATRATLLLILAHILHVCLFRRLGTCCPLLLTHENILRRRAETQSRHQHPPNSSIAKMPQTRRCFFLQPPAALRCAARVLSCRTPARLAVCEVDH